ncbi:MAG: hypothetical protein AAGD13_14715 [Pseudomonadota bacterium]
MTGVQAVSRLPMTGLEAISEKSSHAWLAVFTAIVCAHLIGTPHIEPIERWTAIACFLCALPLAQGPAGRVLQILGAVLLVRMLVVDWILFANHGFLITYFSLFFAVCAVTRADFWSHGAMFSRTMLALLMGAALLHKLVSPYYMTGNQIADMLLRGDGYTQILATAYDGMADVLLATKTALYELLNDYNLQQVGGSTELPDLGLILLFVIYGMTAVSVFVQGLLEAALIWQRWFGIWLHRLIFCFSLLVYTLRPENIFLSMNLMMGYAMTDERAKGMRLPYIIVIAYLLISHLTGFRPSLIR